MNRQQRLWQIAQENLRKPIEPEPVDEHEPERERKPRHRGSRGRSLA